MDKLTKKQLKLLHLIEELTRKNGVPPTIVELKNGLGVKSDQSVYQLLEKIEKAGWIERQPGKRRSIRLINKQPNTRSVESNSAYPLSGGQVESDFSMDAVQRKIFDKLHEINPRVANNYRGAIFTLSQKSYHPDWMAQVANSFRGIFGILTRDIKQENFTESNKGEEKKDTGVQKIIKAFDPNPYSAIEKIERTAWEDWNTLNAYFTAVSHYNDGYETEEKEFLEKIDEFNDLLGKYILPDQLDIYEQIDNLIKQGPDKAVPKDLRKYLRNMAAHIYFFNNVDYRWFDFLRANKLFQPSHQVGMYLSRVAVDIPDKVIELTEKYKDEYKPEEGKSLRRYFITASTQMPTEYKNKIILILSKQKWVQETFFGHDFMFHEMKQLLDKLIAEGEYKSAKKLAENILDLRPASGAIPLREVEGYVEDYYYGEIVDSILKIPVSHQFDFARVLVSFLSKAITIAKVGNEEYFHIWRHFIGVTDRHREDVTDTLIDAVRDISISYLEEAKQKGENLPDALDSLFPDPGSSIFTRIRFYIYARYAVEFREKIQWATVEYFDVHPLDKEYDEMVAKDFCNFDKTFKSKYFQLVNKGPKTKEVRDDKIYVRAWKIRKLFIVKACLDKEQQKIYEDLLGGEEDSKYKPRYSGEMTSWVGPTTPVTSSQLASMTVGEIVDYLISWKPTGGHFGEPSRMGLAREFMEVIKKDPLKYSKEAHKFERDELHPTYFYQYFMGLRESLKETVSIEWESVLGLMIYLVDKGKSNKLPEVETDDWNTNWSSVFQYMADLLENGLTSSCGPSFILRGKIWSVIKYICEDTEPNLEYEKKYGGDNMDYHTLSINTARGEAFNALFQYIFWCDRNEKCDKDDRIVEEAKEVLEDHLDKEKEPGNTIPSIYGRFFPWLLTYNPKWTKTITNKLFPLDDLERRYAVWQTYLTNGIFVNVFKELRPQYEKAIQELKKTSLKKKNAHVDPQEGTINHLMIAYAYGVIEYNDPLLVVLYKEANREQKAVAANFLGRVYIASEKTASKDRKPPAKERLTSFWEWRLANSETPEELSEFGWWLEEDYFDNKWMLERLLETLEKTNGVIKPTYRALEVLKKLAIKYPLLVSKCLLKIVRASYQDRFLHMTKELEIKDIVAQLYNHGDEGVRKTIFQVSDQMLRLGNEDFRPYMKITKKPQKSDADSKDIK